MSVRLTTRYLTVLTVLTILTLTAASAMAQQSGGLSTVSEIGFAAGTGSSIPFWLHANQSGLLDPASANAYTRLGIRRSLPDDSGPEFGFAATLVGRASQASTLFFEELYGEARVAFITVWLGRRIESIGTVVPELSIGSLATSTNATPLPKLVIQTDGYTPFPFLQGYAEFKGSFAHGWFRDDRFVEHPYLHQKSFYAKLGGPLPVNAYAGMVHDAQWGGSTDEEYFGDLPASLDDWWRTVTGRSGGDDAPPDEQAYVQGNHLGIYDVGLTADIRGYSLLAYRQFLFDDKDGLKLKNPGDGLLGLSVSLPTTNWVARILYEYVYTKRQSGPEPVSDIRDGGGGQDDYYNHYIYRSGWTHFDRTLGMPLMILYPNREIHEHERISNNRIVAHHVGLAGRVGSGMTYRLLATYSRNYGTYPERDRVEELGQAYNFKGGLRQYSALIETNLALPGRTPLTLLTALAFDTGEMFDDTFGVRVGLRYRSDRGLSRFD